MKILFLHGWQSTPGGLKPTYLKDHGHDVLNPALPDDDFDAAVRIAQAEFDQGTARCCGRFQSRRGGGDEHRHRRHAVGAAVPGMEAMGNGHDREARHRDPPFPGRRDDPLRRQPGASSQQRPARVGPDRRRHRSPAGRSRVAGGDAGGGGEGSGQQDDRFRRSTTKPATDRITRWLLIAIGIYSAVLVSFLNLVILNSDKVKDRAIFLMADGMILLWIIVGGSLTPLLRKRLVPRMVAIPHRLASPVRAVLHGDGPDRGSHHNHDDQLAPLLGTTPEEAHITASTNYFHVVLCHSVVLFFFMFVVWAWMLSRWDFSPLKVLLLFGITGSIG